MKKFNNHKYIDLTLDAVFKAYFKDSPNVCISLLRHFLPLPKNRKIKSIKYLDSVINPKNPEDKHSLLDLRVKLDNGTSVNIEIQSASKKSFKERILFYLSRLYSLDLKQGDDYQTLCPVYALIFTNFTVFKKLKDYHSIFLLKSEKQPEIIFSHHLGIVLVELKKFKEKSVGHLIDKKDLWTYIIKSSKELTDKDMSVIEKRGNEMKEAVKRLKMLSQEESMRIIEEAREKARRDRVAERAYNIEEGQAKGLKQGLKQGRKEIQKEIVLNLLKKNIDISVISETTSLSKAEIKILKDKNFE